MHRMSEYEPQTQPANSDRYIDGLLATVGVDKSRKAIHTLLSAYRKASAPVIHIVHETPSGAPVFTPDSRLAKIFEELEPKSGETVITKNHPGSFTGTNLQEVLQQTGKSKVVLVGYMAHVCVSTTTRQAAEKGYDVILPREAIGDRDIPGIKGEYLVDVVLKELGDAFGTVVSVDSIVNSQ